MPSTRTVDTKSGRICEAELGDPGSAQWRWGDLLLGKFSRNTVLRPDMYPNQQRHFLLRHYFQSITCVCMGKLQDNQVKIGKRTESTLPIAPCCNFITFPSKTQKLLKVQDSFLSSSLFFPQFTDRLQIRKTLYTAERRTQRARTR